MIIDKEGGSVYSCSYKIALASKFFAIQLKNIPHLKNTIIKVAKGCEIPIENIQVKNFILIFSLEVSPAVPVSAVVYRLKKCITDELYTNKAIESKPLFSTSFFCATNDSPHDIKIFEKALKPSYRSKKGELL